MMKQPLNPTGIAALHSTMTGYVERGDIPGIVTLIAQGDEIHVGAIGVQSIGDSTSMRRDTIFRIASITKPITAAATMVLVDDGRLSLDQSVVPWLPELAQRRVLRAIDAALDDTVPATRDITVRDLLTSTFGFGSVMAMPGTYPIQQPIRDGYLYGDRMPHISLMPDPDEYMRRLGALPLMYQPGERWTYNTSCDVLGVLISRVTGQSFEAFLRERLFSPLGMKDTAFSAPAEALRRLSGLYAFNHERQMLESFDDARHSEFSQPPAFQSGAGGLVSTADDLFAFFRMLLDKGVWQQQRVLSGDAVVAMTSDQLTAAQRTGADIFFGTHSSWGFGMSVNIQRSQPWTVPGRFGWDGGFGTAAYADPSHDFVGILLTQRTLDSPESPAVMEDFWALAYRSLEA